MTQALSPNGHHRPPPIRQLAHTTGRLWLIYSGLEDNDLKELLSRGGHQVRDAVVCKERDGRVRYAFRYASVYVIQLTYRSVASAVEKIRQFDATEPRVSGRSAQHKAIGLLPDGGPQRTETVARIMMAEADEGTVGETEKEAVYANFLDFGEHSVAVSPAGVVIAGEVEDQQIQTYLYYVAQIGAATCRYSENESLLSDVMENIKAKARSLDLETLQQINVSTSKAMLDISDELLNIPPREGFILKTLLKTGNIDVYEERISRMLEIIQHHVEYRHHKHQEANSTRIEFVLFVIAVLGALAGLADIFGTASDTTESTSLATFFVVVAVGVTLVSSLWFRAVTERRSH